MDEGWWWLMEKEIDTGYSWSPTIGATLLFELQYEPLGLVKLHYSTMCNESLLQVIKPSIWSARNSH